ncbi:MAG: hypothetical protein PHG03_02650 [Bacilli bacterium]|nr:hypothetical protein [Bacilli bacterium]
MRKEEKIDFKINKNILKDYVEAINSIKEPMRQIKEQLNQISKPMQELSKTLNEFVKPAAEANYAFESIRKMSEQLKSYSIKYPNEQYKIFTDAIKQIADTNNGMLSTRMIEPLNISRQYLSIMQKNNDIEKIARGIYLTPSAFEDSYFSFQQKYKQVIFSHMNALYFYGMTEEFPYNYTVTVPQNYHVDIVNEKCNVFYVSDEIYEMGVVEVETPNGNKVRVYDKERSICDIIRSKGRMDSEQVKKAIKQYTQSRDKDIVKLSKYSKKMGLSDKVMEIVGGAYYD